MSDILARLSWAFDQASCGDGFEVEVLSDAKAEIERLQVALKIIANLDPHQSDILEARNYARDALAKEEK